MKFFYSFTAVLCILFVTTISGHTLGTITVDSLTFDKVLRNFDVVLAKFDDKFRMLIQLFEKTKSIEFLFVVVV